MNFEDVFEEYSHSVENMSDRLMRIRMSSEGNRAYTPRTITMDHTHRSDNQYVCNDRRCEGSR